MCPRDVKLAAAAVCTTVLACAPARAPIAWPRAPDSVCAAIPADMDRRHGPALLGVTYTGTVHETEQMNGTEHFVWDVASPPELQQVSVDTLHGVPIAVSIESRMTARELCSAIGWPFVGTGCSRAARGRMMVVAGDPGRATLLCVAR